MCEFPKHHWKPWKCVRIELPLKSWLYPKEVYKNCIRVWKFVALSMYEKTRIVSIIDFEQHINRFAFNSFTSDIRHQHSNTWTTVFCSHCKQKNVAREMRHMYAYGVFCTYPIHWWMWSMLRNADENAKTDSTQSDS